MGKYLIAALFCLVTLSAFSQENGKKFTNKKINETPAKIDRKDTIQQDKPQKKRLEPKKEIQEDQESSVDTGEGFEFDQYKEGSVVSVSPIKKEFGELRLVKVSEELKIDSVWVTAAEYYEIWDSKYLNPYRKDASLFKDTISIILYNLPKGELWSAPLETTLQTSNFGYRWGRFHHGIDLNLHNGTPVYSVFDGIVRISAFMTGYGNYVVVRHKNGLETLYAHLSSRKVEVGQEVKAGQLLGLGGSTGWSTGPHLHFEVRYEGNSFNPLSIYDFSEEDQLITNKFDLMPHHFRHLGNKVRKTISHKVLEKETLTTISAKYNVPVQTLARINNLKVDSELKPGQIITIIK